MIKHIKDDPFEDLSNLNIKNFSINRNNSLFIIKFNTNDFFYNIDITKDNLLKAIGMKNLKKFSIDLIIKKLNLIKNQSTFYSKISMIYVNFNNETFLISI